ncbi:MAG TPA: pyridoxamine 5'-phosphate oxidase family protein [Acidimicrobiia bacterium]|nr:pyridoxamine 5'-phosphate oxidase family protein [Acidimicrobiia bacterium]
MATTADPVTELDARYSTDGVTAPTWREVGERLHGAELFWVTTVRPDGRPHVTPTLALWVDDALYFSTGPYEQKAKNISGNAHCSLMTGCNILREGMDLVVEGEATRVRDDGTLRRIADAYVSKYGEEWRFEVRDGAFHHDPGEAWVFEVAPVTAYAFGKGEYSHTRWRFGTA